MAHTDYGASREPNSGLRERLMAESTLVNLGSALNDGFNLQTQGNGNGRGGTCNGDSGGPGGFGMAQKHQSEHGSDSGSAALTP